MWGVNLIYIFTDSLHSIRENFVTTALTSLTLGFSLAIFSIFFFIFLNLNGAVSTWGDRTNIIIYVKENSSAAGADRMKEALLKIPGVKSADYVSKERAIKDLKDELKGHESVLEGIDVNPLPASYEIKVMDSYRDSSRVASVVERLRKLDWVEDLQYSLEWVEKLSAFLKFIELAALAIGIFLAAATVFIISNTIRLTVYARKEEIEVMRLVGASGLFIKVPFFIEGVLQGIMGGLLALGVIAAGRLYFLSRIPAYFSFALQMPFSWPLIVGMVVLTGIFMGVVGSLVTMGKLLKI